MLTWDELIAYVGAVHARTFEAASLLDDARIGWTPRPGEFSAGALVLHIANTRAMNADTIRGRATRYRGHELAPGATADRLRQALLRSSKKTIAAMAEAGPDRAVRSLSSGEVPAWRIAIAGLIEHEVHHRSQLCEYLGAMGIAAPALYGLHAEDLPR